MLGMPSPLVGRMYTGLRERGGLKMHEFSSLL